MGGIITVSRKNEFSNKLRDYSVLIDGEEICQIESGGSKSFEVDNGVHEICLKIDWCGSNKIKFDSDDGERISFNISGCNPFLSLFYMIFSKEKYLNIERGVNSVIGKDEHIEEKITKQESSSGFGYSSVSVLNVGYLFAFFSIIVRWILSINYGYEFFDLNSFSRIESWVYCFSFVCFCVSFWNTFLRFRCPECESTDINNYRIVEIDRWIGIKTVSEKLSDGKYVDKKLNVTYAKREYFYLCNSCKYKWSSIHTEEK